MTASVRETVCPKCGGSLISGGVWGNDWWHDATGEPECPR